MLLCQRLPGEHIQRRADQLPAVERGHQIRFQQMIAAADLNEIPAAPHRVEHIAVEDAAGLLGQRQQVHQNFGVRQHRGQAVEAVEAVMPAGTGFAPRLQTFVGTPGLR